MWRRQAVAEPARFPQAGSFAFVRLACLLAVLALAGCSAFGSSELEFTPAKLPTCKGPLIAVHVRWNFEAQTNERVRIYISSPGGPPKVWNVAAPKGEASTGRWMHDGSTITVRSSKGKLLGVRTLETAPCKKAG